MFQDACELARHFTRPVVMSTQVVEGGVSAGVGAFVVLNPDGWILTAAHIANDVLQCVADQSFVAEYDNAIDRIKAETNPNKRMTERKKLDRNLAVAMKNRRPYIRRAGLMWGVPGIVPVHDFRYQDSDILLFKVNSLEPLGVDHFPRFKRPTGLRAGTSLVRAGYAFNDAKCRYDEATSTFVNETRATPLFAIEGILSRELEMVPEKGGDSIHMIETSSPGLMGQSGGPILDRNGDILGIQSSTICLDLQFNAVSKDADGDYKERQFLNVGRGISTKTLEPIFARHGVSVDWAA